MELALAMLIAAALAAVATIGQYPWVHLKVNQHFQGTQQIIENEVRKLNEVQVAQGEAIDANFRALAEALPKTLKGGHDPAELARKGHESREVNSADRALTNRALAIEVLGKWVPPEAAAHVWNSDFIPEDVRELVEKASESGVLKFLTTWGKANSGMLQTAAERWNAGTPQKTGDAW